MPRRCALRLVAMSRKRNRRWPFALAILIAIVIGVPAAFILFGVPVNLGFARSEVEKAATSALGREVAVEGSMELVPALWPTVEVKGLRIANPPPWAGTDFVRVDLARLQLGLLPLLSGNIHLGEITAEGVTVHLERNAEGEVNWQFDPRDAAAQPTPEIDTGSDDDAAPPFQFVGLDEITLRRIEVSYKDGDTDETTVFALDDLIGEAPRGEPVDVTIHGSIQRQPYTVSIEGGPLAGLATAQEPWPAKLTAEIGGASLQVEGVLDEALEGKAVDLSFKLAGNRLEDLEAVAGTALPPIGAYGLGGRVRGSATAYGLTELEGTFGDTALTGEVTLDISDKRPRLSGALAIAVLDLGPFLLDAPERKPTPDEAPAEASTSDPEFSTGDIELGKLQLVDVDFNLSIGRVANAPGEISDATLSLKIEGGVLAAPMSVSIGEVPFSGAVEIDAAGEIPELNLSLRAEQTDIGKLAVILAGAEGIEGRIENAEFTASGRGTNPRTIIDGLDMRFAVNDASLSYGNETGGQPVNFSLDTGEISVDGAGREMAVVAAGALLDKPFLLALSGGGLTALLNGEPWPLDLSASSGDAELQVRGMVGPATAPESIELELELAGKRMGDLAAWLGVSPSANMPYAISGRAVRTKDEVRLSALEARVGRTKVAGELRWIKTEEDPLIVVDLNIDALAPRELGDLAPSDEAKSAKTDEQGLTIDMPILPQDVTIDDSDFDIAIKRIFLQPADVTNVSFAGRVRNGRLARSPFKAAIGGAVFTGDVALDLAGQTPEFVFNLASEKVDVGELLQRVHLAEGIEVTTDLLKINLALKGSSLRQIADNSGFSADLTNGHWTLRDPDTGASLKIRILEGAVRASPNEPITLALDGRIAETPVKIEIKTDRLTAFVDPRDKLPLSFTVDAAGAHLELNGEIALPAERQELSFRAKLTGERLDSLDELTDVSLPPLGPYAVGGQFSVRKGGYYLSDLDVRVGESDLKGDLSLEMTGVRPRVDVKLTTSSLQIDDFDVEDWSPVESEAEETTTAATAKTENDDQETLLSPEVMRSLDAGLTVKVEEVLSGKDHLGSGSLEATLEDGRFSVAPLEINIPGGTVNVAFAYEPTDVDVSAEASAHIEKLDYGVLARRIDPEKDLKGLISVDMDLRSRAKDLDVIMGNASGRLDFAVWPEDLDAGLFDLWAVNLVLAVLPSLDAEPTSVVNCLIGRFDLNDGIMEPDALMFDTTEMRVKGEGKVDFTAEKVEFLLKPRAKTPQMFGAATPVTVEGTFSDFNVGLRSGAALGTILRMTTSVVTAPVKRVFSSRLPADGKDVCDAPIRRSAGSEDRPADQ